MAARTQQIKYRSLKFPAAGLNKRLAYHKSSDLTTPAALNCIPDDVLGLGRERGGSRPGLTSYGTTGSGPWLAGSEVRYLSSGNFLNRTVGLVAGTLYVDNGSGTWSSAATGGLSIPTQLASYLQMIFFTNSSGIKAYSPNGNGGQIDATSTFFGFAQSANKDLFEPTSYGAFAGGSVTIAAGVVTLAPDTVPVISPGTGTTTTTWPAWTAISGLFILNGISYTINTRDSGTQITLDDTSVTASTPQAFLLQSRFPVTYDLLSQNAPSPPTNCTLICRYRDRLAVSGQTGSGNSPLAVYLCASGDYRDWRYGATGGPGDAAAMVAAPNSGSLSDIPTALIAHNDACLIFGMRGSMSVLRGDPTNGGSLDPLVDGVGVLSATSWCYDDEGYLWFMSNRGLYVMDPGCGTTPHAVSPNVLPSDLSGIDPSVYRIWLAYDSRFRGLHLLITKISDNSTNHWFIALKTTLAQGDQNVASFWPIDYSGDTHVPVSAFTRSHFYGGNSVSPVLFSKDNGAVAYWDTAISCASDSYLDYGPLQLADEGYAGLLDTYDILVASGSGSITGVTRVGQSAEQAFNASTFHSQAFPLSGLNAKARPRARGSHAVIRVKNTSGATKWSVENIRVSVGQVSGPARFVGTQ